MPYWPGTARTRTRRRRRRPCRPSSRSRPVGFAGVAGRDEAVRVVDGFAPRCAVSQAVGAEEVDGLRVVVELVDQQHVRPHPLDHFGHLGGLRIVRRGQVPHQRPPPAVVQVFSDALNVAKRSWTGSGAAVAVHPAVAASTASAARIRRMPAPWQGGMNAHCRSAQRCRIRSARRSVRRASDGLLVVGSSRPADRGREPTPETVMRFDENADLDTSNVDDLRGGGGGGGGVGGRVAVGGGGLGIVGLIIYFLMSQLGGGSWAGAAAGSAADGLSGLRGPDRRHRRRSQSCRTGATRTPSSTARSSPSSTRWTATGPTSSPAPASTSSRPAPTSSAAA